MRSSGRARGCDADPVADQTSRLSGRPSCEGKSVSTIGRRADQCSRTSSSDSLIECQGRSTPRPQAPTDGRPCVRPGDPLPMHARQLADPKGLKMQPVYHFTDSAHLPWILSDGELRPGANKIGGYPALWRAVAVSQVLPAGFRDLARSSS